MIRRLLILIPLTALTFGSANCSSAVSSADSKITAMINAIWAQNLPEFLSLFDHELITENGQRRYVRVGTAAERAREPDIFNARSEGVPLLIKVIPWTWNHPEDNFMQVLIDFGADVNAEYGSETPLTMATRFHKPEVVKLLVQNGAGRGWGSALKNATKNGEREIIRELAPRATLQELNEAIAAGNLQSRQMIQPLIEQRESIEKKEGAGNRAELEKEAEGKAAEDRNERTWQAIKDRDIEAFKKMFKYEFIPAIPEAGFPGQSERVGNRLNEPDVNALGSDIQWSPLIQVLNNQYPIEWVRLLIDFGANVNDVRYHHYTPLELAAERDNLDAVKILIAAGADCNIKSPGGRYPLVTAVGRGTRVNLEIVRILARCSNDKVVNWALESARGPAENYADQVEKVIRETRAAMPQGQPEEEKKQAAEEENEFEPGMAPPEPLPAVPGGPKSSEGKQREQ